MDTLSSDLTKVNGFEANISFRGLHQATVVIRVPPPLFTGVAKHEAITLTYTLWPAGPGSHHYLLVINVGCNPLPQHQLHSCRVAQLDRGLHNQVDPLILWGDPVQVHRVMHGGVPGGCG